MDKVESRRVAPIGWVTTIVVLILFAFELLMMFGAIELRAATVAKYAPWAYEPFLKLVGEHPDSAPVAVKQKSKKGPTKKSELLDIIDVTGISAEAIKVDLDIDVPEPAERAVLEPVVEPEPEPAKDPKDVVPVG